MNQKQLWQARAARARQSAEETRNEGQKSLLLLYAQECERKAEQNRPHGAAARDAGHRPKTRMSLA